MTHDPKAVLKYYPPPWAASPQHDGICLEEIRGGVSIRKIELKGPRDHFIIGREPEKADIAVLHPSVSRQHAVIQFAEDGKMLLYDLKSTHGTKRNGRPIPAEKFEALRVGDQLQVGQATRVFVLNGPDDLLPEEKNIQECKEARRKEVEQMKAAQKEEAGRKDKAQGGSSASSSKSEKATAAEGGAADGGEADEYIDERTGLLDTAKLRERRGASLSVKQEEALSKIEELQRKLEGIQREAAKLDSDTTAAFNAGHSDRLEGLAKREEKLQDDIFQKSDALLVTLGLGGASHGWTRLSKKQLEFYDTTLTGEDDSFFDRSGEKTLMEEELAARKRKDAVTVDNEQSLSVKVDELLAEADEVRGQIERMESDAKAKEAESADAEDPLDAFMCLNGSAMTNTEVRKLRARLKAIEEDLANAERRLQKLQKGQQKQAGGKRGEGGVKTKTEEGVGVKKEKGLVGMDRAQQLIQAARNRAAAKLSAGGGEGVSASPVVVDVDMEDAVPSSSSASSSSLPSTGGIKKEPTTEASKGGISVSFLPSAKMGVAVPTKKEEEEEAVGKRKSPMPPPKVPSSKKAPKASVFDLEDSSSSSDEDEEEEGTYRSQGPNPKRQRQEAQTGEEHRVQSGRPGGRGGGRDADLLMSGEGEEEDITGGEGLTGGSAHTGLPGLPSGSHWLDEGKSGIQLRPGTGAKGSKEEEEGERGEGEEAEQEREESGEEEEEGGERGEEEKEEEEEGEPGEGEGKESKEESEEEEEERGGDEEEEVGDDVEANGGGRVEEEVQVQEEEAGQERPRDLPPSERRGRKRGRHSVEEKGSPKRAVIRVLPGAPLPQPLLVFRIGPLRRWSGLESFPDLHNLVAELPAPYRDSYEYLKTKILKASGEKEEKRLLDAFHSLATLSSSQHADAEQFGNAVETACQRMATLSLREERVCVYKGTGDPDDDANWKVVRQQVPLLDPLGRRDGQLASLLLLNGISDPEVRAQVRNALPAHMPFYGDDKALEKFRTFAKPSCFLPVTPVRSPYPQSQPGVSVAGKPPSRPANPQSGRAVPPQPNCTHPGHKAEHCLKQHFCPSCFRWGHKPGDCELAKDIDALLRAYGYPPRNSQGRSGGRSSRQKGATLTGATDFDTEDSDNASDSNPAAAAAGRMKSASSSDSPRPSFSFDGLGCMLDVGASSTTCTRGWLVKKKKEVGLKWTEEPLPNPVSVRSACTKKVWMRKRASIPCFLDGKPAVLKPSIMETEAVTLPLVGNERLIEMGATFDYQTGHLHLPSTVLKFLCADNDLFLLPLEIDRTGPPQSECAPSSQPVSSEAAQVEPASSVFCSDSVSASFSSSSRLPTEPRLDVLANGRLPLRLKKARRNRRQPKPREASPSCQHSEQAESPTSSSAPTPRPLPPASDPGRLSVKATVDELIRSHHEWLGHPGIETTWRSLRVGLRDIPSLKGGISRNAVRRALLLCIQGGTCGRVKPRHAGDGSRGSLEVT
uniref:FHA domain-containing protein n=1 Tax=Chromera velia CCMP2878 TaxID=1169474 RepID=A0A0G4HGY1_9ALVE|eukprot:Cvel_27479.t1-p1 / transcript=Cvel_27479.t1 / gene=Cvel_27479 / organism=Chromera_velia_CCMP2878 / gene_product=Kanadaptin, putative / transcript_product=Kanadaptin, putative / location=Cvel_scaffold3434:1461-11816(-) / protein_length=1479 / sequence_SO=supercontig / SO=protein_coding / is_pseudo=false